MAPLRWETSDRRGMADVIVRNAHIITINARRPTAEALSIRRGFIQSIGGVDEVMRHRMRATRVVDLGGRFVIPGLIGQELPKDAADLIDWIEFEPAKVAAEGMDSFLSTKLDLMTAGPLAVSLHGGSRLLVDTLLARLAELADAPLAVCIAGDAECFVNPLMADDLSRLGSELETRVAAPAGYVGRASLPAVVRALAGGGLAMHTTRMIDNAIVRCVRAGFVAVRDRTLGALTGMAELEATLDLAGQSRLRVRGVTHERLRERANPGKLRPGYGNDMFRVDATSIEFPSKLPLAALQAEVVSLEAQGWPVEFRVRNSAGLADAIAVGSGVSTSPREPRKRRTVFLSWPPDRNELAELQRANLAVAFPVSNRASSRADGKTRLPEDAVRPFTVDAARGSGLHGRLGVGMPADLTVLERLPRAGEAVTDIPGLRTWVDGTPVATPETNWQ